MIFFWDAVNLAEITAHGVDTSTAEAIFKAPDLRIKDCGMNRFLAEGTVRRSTYRVPFSKVFPEGMRIVTTFRIHSKRRKI